MIFASKVIIDLFCHFGKDEYVWWFYNVTYFVTNYWWLVRIATLLGLWALCYCLSKGIRIRSVVLCMKHRPSNDFELVHKNVGVKDNKVITSHSIDLLSRRWLLHVGRLSWLAPQFCARQKRGATNRQYNSLALFNFVFEEFTYIFIVPWQSWLSACVFVVRYFIACVLTCLCIMIHKIHP